MGENNLKPIVGRSRVLEEQRIREEELRRERRRIANARRRKQQKIKAIAMLTTFLCIIVFGIGAIVYLIASGGNEDGTVNTDTEENSVQLQKVDVQALGLNNLEYVYECTDATILEKLKNKAEKNSVIQFVYDNYKAYPETVLKALSNNSELADFVLKYPVETKKEHDKVPTVEGMYTKGEMPLFIQWDERWGYYSYGEDVIGMSGCGPTCLSMVAVALTGNDEYTPTMVADFAMDNGYYYEGAGTTWELFNKGIERFGLKSRTVGLSESSMIEALENGEYLVLSMAPGIFTSIGHYIVIYDYKDGEFFVKDPNSNVRSATTYEYNAFKDQIKNIWAISK